LDVLQKVHVSSGGGEGAEVRGQGSESGGPSSSESLRVGERAEGLRDGEFWAVEDVSFELRRGECLGLIGHNGARTQAARGAARTTAEGSPQGAMSGSEQVNTTLLKMLNGLIKPDSGKITMRGRVARWSMQKTPQANGALIALGGGVQSDPDGRNSFTTDLRCLHRSRNAGNFLNDEHHRHS
jgi:lipopolysaccharide transport system ATP-binding protein